MITEFNNLGEATEQQFKDDTYSQCIVFLTMHELMALKEGKTLYANLHDGHSVVITNSKE